MKVCIPALGVLLEAKVGTRFDRTPYFIFADSETGSFEAVVNPFADKPGSVGPKLQFFVPDIHAFHRSADVGVIRKHPSKKVSCRGKCGIHRKRNCAGYSICHHHPFFSHLILHPIKENPGKTPAPEERISGEICHFDRLILHINSTGCDCCQQICIFYHEIPDMPVH